MGHKHGRISFGKNLATQNDAESMRCLCSLVLVFYLIYFVILVSFGSSVCEPGHQAGVMLDTHLGNSVIRIYVLYVCGDRYVW